MPPWRGNGAGRGQHHQNPAKPLVGKEDRVERLRMDAAIAHAPDAAMRVRVAQDVAALDEKLASVAAKVPRVFYDPIVEAGMQTRVNVESPLRTADA